jgi:putative methyltransferase (TIGR04325 family)
MDSRSAQELIGGPFATYADAQASCTAIGYDDERVANVVLLKTRLYRELLLNDNYPKLNANQARQLLGLSLSINGDHLSVLDFGGACGVHYFLAKHVLGDRVKFDWNVVETRSMTRTAKAFESDELHFFDSLDTATDNARRYDLVFISGSLQYIPSPRETLKQLIGCDAPNMFLTRIALSITDDDYISIHESRLPKHGRGGPLLGIPDGKTQCPVVMAGRKKIESLLSQNYEVVFGLTEAVGVYRTGELSFDQYGYFCRRRNL